VSKSKLPPAARERQRHRTVYDASGSMSLPGKIARDEGAPPAQDTAVNEAYDGLGMTYDFFWEVYGRNSIDDKGMPLLAIVHYGHQYDNAFWNGRQIIIGDGDGTLFNRFTIAIDVIAHTLTHGIIQAEAALSYWQQTGALVESISDVFGSLVKQYVLKQTASQADWLIGAGLFAPQIKGRALRSLANPGTAYDDPLLGKDPQSSRMSDYVKTKEDNGGVHLNSGIPNHAFYLVATILGGYAWERAGRIWYEALRAKRLRENIRFRDFAQRTFAAALKLYGKGKAEADAVRAGWQQVGIRLGRG
jgi:Zn-dependent metalloprotease